MPSMKDETKVNLQILMVTSHSALLCLVREGIRHQTHSRDMMVREFYEEAIVLPAEVIWEPGPDVLSSVTAFRSPPCFMG